MPKATQLVRSVTTGSYIWYLCPNSILAATVVPLTIPWSRAHPTEWLHWRRKMDLYHWHGSLQIERKDCHLWIHSFFFFFLNSFFLILILFHKEDYTASSEPLSTRASQASRVWFACCPAKVLPLIKEQEAECQWLPHTWCNGTVKSFIVPQCVSVAVTWALAFFGQDCAVWDSSYFCIQVPFMSLLFYHPEMYFIWF